MSIVRFFPIKWFEDAKWRSIQVTGYLENGRSIYLHVKFKPFLTIKYMNDISEVIIEDNHNFLTSETPVAEIKHIKDAIYRIYVQDKEDYFNTVDFVKKNIDCKIIDETQSIKSKFFSERSILPGFWQQASNLQTLSFNISANDKYASTDLEFYTDHIQTIDHDAPIPRGKNVFFDIECIPNDDVSFPDAERDQPPDRIFAISLVLVSPTVKVNNIYLLTGQELPNEMKTNKERTEREYNIVVYTVATEKELLERFYQDLLLINPDRLISMNGRQFDINYIVERSKSLGVMISPFTKILKYIPQTEIITIAKTKPFPILNQVWSIDTPGVSQIDLLDFYGRFFPNLGNHKLETIGLTVLGRGKTGLGIREMFERYRRGTKEDLEIIIDYSIVDSILLSELWETSQIEKVLTQWASFWRSDSEDVITTDMEKLFDDLLRYWTSDIPEKKNDIGKYIETERMPGIHHNIYLYNLSPLYLSYLSKLPDPFAQSISKYFSGSDYGYIPFKSKYFPVSFDDVRKFLNQYIPNERRIWIEENSLAILLPVGEGEIPYPFINLVEHIPLVIVANKSWITVNTRGIIFRKGLSSFVRPPFKLIDRYVNYTIDSLIKNPTEIIKYPDFETSLDDFILEAKVTAEDFSTMPKRKEEIINQLRELGIPITTSWRKIRYIKTVSGIVIEDIYLKDTEKYAKMIDLKYYNGILRRSLASVFGKK